MWPDITEGVAPDERRAVERALVVPLLRAHDEDLAAAFGAADAFTFVVVAGAVLKETTLSGVAPSELFGPGEILAPLVNAGEARAVSRYLALGPVSIAVLGTRFHQVAARWPQISAYLHGQLAEQTHRASLHLAILHLSRAEDRILAFFEQLAGRFGRVTLDGIRIRLPLSHALIGRLTACRRPTASLALQHLHDQGRLTRLEDDTWRLPMPPAV